MTGVRTGGHTGVHTGVRTGVPTGVLTGVPTGVRTGVLTGVLVVCSLVFSAQAPVAVRQAGTPQPPRPAQAPDPRQGPRPTFRGGINYVRVDMYATLDGQPVMDLRQDEIDILEDGAKQTIKDFERVDVRSDVPQAQRIEPTSVEDSRQMAADPRTRVFVLYLDTLHISTLAAANVRGPLVRFLDRLLGADDMIAVMTPEMSARDVTFARKTTVIGNIMERDGNLWGRRDGDVRDPKEDLYSACYDTPKDRQTSAQMISRLREQQSLDALEELVGVLDGVREERKAVITVSEGWVLYTPDRTLEAKRDQTPPQVPKPFDKLRRAPQDQRGTSGNEQIECDTDRRMLAALDDSSRMREITDAANRGNVTFYPIDPRGLTTFDSPMSGPTYERSVAKDADNLRDRQSALRTLADDTDGMAVMNSNNIDAGLARIVSDLSSYYLLGYESTNSRMDGKFRSITVRVKRPGVKVRNRRGYRGLRPDEVLSRTDAEGGAATRAAMPSVVVNARAPFRMRPVTWVSGTTAMMWLVGEMDYATRRELEWSNGAVAEISVVSGSGERVADLEVPFPASDGAFTVQLPPGTTIKAGDYAVRIRVTPKVGQAVPLTDLQRVTVPAAPTPIGEALMLRRGLSTGTKYLATADPRFQRSDRLRLELPTRVEGIATARLLDRSGKPLIVPVTVSERRDDAGFRWIVADATLAPMAMGDYAVEITLAGAKQVTPFRVVP